MLRSLAAVAAVCALALAPSPAQAVVTYTLVDQVYTFAQPVAGRDPRVPFNLSFTLTDGAVASGSFSVSGSGSFGQGINPVFTGNVGGFISAQVDQDFVSPTRLLGDFALNLTFDQSRQITAGTLFLRGDLTDASLTFGPGTLAGSFAGEYSAVSCVNSASGPGCAVSGRVLTTVPEPMSIALLGVGLTGLAVSRTRRL